MKRLEIDSKMPDYEKRLMINEALEQMDKRGILNEEVVRNWLIEQVEGVEKNGTVITFKTLDYEDVLLYYLELYGY